MPPLIHLDTFGCVRRNTSLWSSLGPQLKLRLKLHEIQIDAVKEFVNGGFTETCTAHSSKVLVSLIGVYDERLVGVLELPLEGHGKTHVLHFKIYH